MSTYSRTVHTRVVYEEGLGFKTMPDTKIIRKALRMVEADRGNVVVFRWLRLATRRNSPVRISQEELEVLDYLKEKMAQRILGRVLI